MIARRGFRRIVMSALAALSLGVLPACQGAGIFGRDRQALRPNPAVVPYSAYRPAYSPGPPRRTLFFGNYAGFNYNRSTVNGVVPTRFGVQAWGYPIPKHDHTHPDR